jgi:hypothetical protein
MSILTGIAANKSIASGMPITVKDLIEFWRVTNEIVCDTFGEIA